MAQTPNRDYTAHEWRCTAGSGEQETSSATSLSPYTTSSYVPAGPGITSAAASLIPVTANVVLTCHGGARSSSTDLSESYIRTDAGVCDSDSLPSTSPSPKLYISTPQLEMPPWEPQPGTSTEPQPSTSSHQVKSELRNLLAGRLSENDIVATREELAIKEEPPECVDQERLLRRREQNRLAAQRCRKRKRDVADGLFRECQAMECSNTELRYKIRVLETERDKLRMLWDAHVRKHQNSS